MQAFLWSTKRLILHPFHKSLAIYMYNDCSLLITKACILPWKNPAVSLGSLTVKSGQTATDSSTWKSPLPENNLDLKFLLILC